MIIYLLGTIRRELGYSMLYERQLPTMRKGKCQTRIKPIVSPNDLRGSLTAIINECCWKGSIGNVMSLFSIQIRTWTLMLSPFKKT